MKTITHISWLIALFASLQITVSHAQTSFEPITQQVTLHVERAGTLPFMIDENQKFLITNLKLTGELNGTDIFMLREMASKYSLEKLDLSDAEIIEGASPYFESAGTSYTTSTWTISPYMFYNCNLKSIKLPKTTKKICQYAFSGCKQLSDIEIPEGVTEILGPAFRDCSSLTHVNIPKGVTNMRYAFQNCSGLTNVNIPESVTDLSYAFQYCTNLTHVNIAEGVTGLVGAFQNCVALKTIDIPKSVTNLSGAFKNCYSLTNVNIPEGVMYMNGAFECCYGLTNVNIPKSVTDLSRAFIGCNLTNVNIPEGVTNLSEAFYGCTLLTHVDIPEGVTNMSYAFRDCSILTHVDIPEGVTDLSYTFSGCTNLTSVNILGESPLPLNEYGFKNTFEDCYDLQAIRFFSPAPLIPSIYPKISNDVIVYIPKGSMSAYSATCWGDYNLVEFDATDIDTPIRTDKAGAREHYSIDGKRLTAPQRGLNIIREADGTTKKILIQ